MAFGASDSSIDPGGEAVGEIADFAGRQGVLWIRAYSRHLSGDPVLGSGDLTDFLGESRQFAGSGLGLELGYGTMGIGGLVRARERAGPRSGLC